MHKKIMKEASKALKEDALKYVADMKKSKSPSKKAHDRVEYREAMSASKDMKKRSKKAHEF